MINNDNVNNKEINNNTNNTIEEVENEVSERAKPQFLPSKMMVMVRLLLGGYLVYTSYELIKPIIIKEATNELFNISFAILFVVAGIIIIFFSAKSLKIGKYIGGALDQSIVKETEEIVIEDEEINKISNKK